MSFKALTPSPSETHWQMRSDVGRLHAFCVRRIGEYTNPKVELLVSDLKTVIAYRDVLQASVNVPNLKEAGKDIEEDASYDVLVEADAVIVLLTDVIDSLIATIPVNAGSIMADTLDTETGAIRKSTVSDTAAVKSAMQTLANAIV